MKIIQENDKTYYVIEYNNSKFISIENLLMYIILLIEFKTEELNNIVSEYRSYSKDDFSSLKIQIRAEIKRINYLLEEYESILRTIK